MLAPQAVVTDAQSAREALSVPSACLSHTFAAAGLVRGLQTVTDLKLKEHQSI